MLTKLPSAEFSRYTRRPFTFGSTVVMEDLETGEVASYRLVGPYEADVQAGTISVTSPLGKALIGKEEGEEVRVSIVRGAKEANVPGTVCNAGGNVGINFDALTLQQLRDITAVTFSTADMWIQKTGKSKPKTPFSSLSEIFFYSRLTFSKAFKRVFMNQRSIAKDVR